MKRMRRRRHRRRGRTASTHALTARGTELKLQRTIMELSEINQVYDNNGKEE
jgi:hypothetical protein